MPQVPSMYERYILARKFGAEVHLTSVDMEAFDHTITNLLGYAADLVNANESYWVGAEISLTTPPVFLYVEDP